MSTPPREDVQLLPAQLAKRDRIIAAAVEVLLVHGVHGCTVRAMAKHAGVSNGTVHYYFDDVDRIVDAAMLREMQRLLSSYVGELLELTGVDGVEEKAVGVTAYLFWVAMQKSNGPVDPGMVRRHIAAMCRLPVPIAMH